MPNGVNILLDCTITATFAAADLGGGETFTNSTTFKADKVSVKITTSTADHSTAQDTTEFHRITKRAWEVTVETKLADSVLFSRIGTNALATLSVTAATGLGLSGMVGVITSIEPEYSGPSTLKFTLKPRGSQPTIA